MQDLSNPVVSEADYLAARQPDRPVLFFHPSRLRESARMFIDGFPGLVTYAVKANDNVEVLENLVMSGIDSFDVASPAEMLRVRQVKPDAVLHYHNPVRSRSEIQRALQFGITSWSVDTLSELDKLKGIPAGSEIAVRLRLPVSGSAYDFGEKFGADPEHAVELLKAAKVMGFRTSMTFHPGTQCDDPSAWQRYIQVCAEVSQAAGIPLERLNVGGGFAAHRTGARPDLAAAFRLIKSTTVDIFGEDHPKLVCEPGRAMASEGFSLATRVKAVFPDGRVFLNDGVYGALAEWRDIGQMDRYQVYTSDGQGVAGPASNRIVFGPTCDSLDRLPGELSLPDAMADEDFVLFEGMGAYSAAITTRFNGYGDLIYVTVR